MNTQTTKTITNERACRLGMSAIAVALMSATAVPVMAQETQQVSESTDSGSDGNGEITVTARRRSEALQDVPLSVSAFGEEQLSSRGLTTFKDIKALIPGLQYSDRGTLQTEITIRGVGGDSRNIGIESGVGMYIDGVYVARTSGYNGDLADVAQVEVLRGPQGTLYGKNTIGGVVNITTKKPTDKFEGSFYASYGNYNALKTQASISGPISENLFGKITVATSDRDGYLYNRFVGSKLNNEDRRGGRLQLRWLPTDSLEVELSADATRDRQNYVLNQMGSAAGAAAPYFNGNPREVDTDQKNISNRDMWGGSVTVNYTTESDYVLTSISAFRKIDILVYSDIDQTPNDIFHSGPFTDKSKMFTQELRVISPSNRPLRFVGGLYYFGQRSNGIREIYIGGAHAASNDAGTDTDSFAGYVNADYDLAEKLTLTGGLRYTSESKDGRFYQWRPPSLNYNFPVMRRKDDNLSWTASLRYKFSPLLTGYVSASKGYKSGGFNLDTIGVANLIPSDLTFGPESVINYEAGLKGRTANNLFNFSLSVFDLEYKDKQVSQFVSTGATTIPSNQVTNAGQARIKGFEAEASIKPFDGFTLSANTSYLDAKYTSFPDALPGGVSFTGHRIERTPKWTAALNADLRVPAGGGSVILNGGMTYTGDTFLQADNDPLHYEKGYVLLNGKIGFEAASGLEISVWGKNLTQETYRSFSRVFAGLLQVVYGEPRTYGIEARYRF